MILCALEDKEKYAIITTINKLWYLFNKQIIKVTNKISGYDKALGENTQCTVLKINQMQIGLCPTSSFSDFFLACSDYIL